MSSLVASDDLNAVVVKKLEKARKLKSRAVYVRRCDIKIGRVAGHIKLFKSKFPYYL